MFRIRMQERDIMENFVNYTPTKVVFGKDTQKETGRLIREAGGSRVLIVYGGGSAVRSGLLSAVEASVSDAGLAYESFGGVKANPTLVSF